MQHRVFPFLHALSAHLCALRSHGVAVLLLACALLLSFAVHAADDDENLPHIPDWFQQKGFPDTASGQSDTPHETINHFTGKLHYVFTDLVIPGNGGMDLKIQRHYNNIDDPYSTLDVWNNHPHSPLGIGWNLHMGKVQRSGPICASTWPTASNNPIWELPDGSRHVLYEQSHTNSPIQWFSKDFWRAQCVENRLHIQSPDGTTYEMTEPGHTSEPANTWHVGRIIDRNGNWFAFHYQNLLYGAKVLSQITSSDNRNITFTYSADARLTNITDTATGRTWNYSVTSGIDAQKFLTKVERTDGAMWKYTYHNGSPGTGSLSRVENPAGGTINYQYGHVDFKTGTPWQGQKSTVVIQKTASISGTAPDFPASPDASGTWTWAYTVASEALASTTQGTTTTYSYNVPPVNPAALNTTSVTDPTGAVTKHYHIGIRSVPLMPTTVGLSVGSQSPLETTQLGYQAIHISNQWDVIAYNLTTAHYYPRAYLIDQHYISRNGTLRSIQKSNFDTWGNPATIVETASNNHSNPALQRTHIRQTNLTYAINTSQWLLHQIASQTTTVDNQSHTTTHQYDDNGNLLQQTIAGTSSSHTYHPTGDLASSTNANGHTTSYNNYHRGTAQQEQQPANIIITRAVDDAGNITSVTNGRGYTTGYAYDSLGRIIKITPPVGNIVHVTWTPTSRLVWRGDGTSYLSMQDLTTWDSLGRMVRRQVTTPPDALGQTLIGVDWHYDILGRRTFQSYPNSNLGTGFVHDSLNRITATLHGTTQGSGSAQSIEYTTYGNLQTIRQNTAGHGSIDIYRSFGNPEEQHNLQTIAGEINGSSLYIATQTDTTRDLLGQPLTVTVDGSTRTWEYDSRYFPISRTDPETGTTTFTRDSLGNLLSKATSIETQGQTTGPTTHYTYDARSRLVGISYPNSPHSDIPHAPSVSYSYNASDQLETVNNGTVTRSYTHDPGDKLTNETLSVGGISQTIGYSYNNQEHLSSVTYPSGHSIHFHPDALGRATQIAPYVTEIQYHPSGSPSAIRHANGILTAVTFNARQWPASLRHGQNASNALTHSLYSYDQLGNLTNIGEYADGSYARLYEYDSLNRLTAEAATDGWRQYGYDAKNNLTWQSTPQGLSQYLYNPDSNLLTGIAGSIQRSYQYDSVGNVVHDGIRNYGYDRANHLRCIHCGTSIETQYIYDGAGQRASTEKNGETTSYLYNQHGLLLQTVHPDGSRIEHIYLGRRQIAERRVDTDSTEAVTHIHTDVSGSPQVATDESGNVLWKESYRAYGQRRHTQAASHAHSQWFHGKEQDPETGLQYFGARYYDPHIGRFMAIDPVDYQDGNPFSFNRYAYGNNNPVRYIDHNGMWAEDIALALPGMVLGSYSLVDNFRQGRYISATVDGLGLIADSIALATPGIPGGAGLAIQASRKIGNSGGNFVYRGLAHGENPSKGLFARSPNAGNTEISHVAGKIESQWISTTKDLNTAIDKYGQNGFVRIDLDKITSQVSDVSFGFPRGGRMSNWAKKDQEVLIKNFIPPDAIKKIDK